jgi:Na+/proline symporter
VGIFASVLLIAAGAILTFALNVSVGWLDLDVVGWILMGAGALGLLFITLIWKPRNRAAIPTDAPTVEIRREEQMPRF